MNAALELPVWGGFDLMVSISDHVSETFCSVSPSLRSKLLRIDNVLTTHFVRQRALGQRPDDMPLHQGADENLPNEATAKMAHQTQQELHTHCSTELWHLSCALGLHLVLTQ